MRVAVCLHGHLRSYKQTHLSFQRFISQFDECEVFIHTWDKTESETATYYQQKSKPELVDPDHIDEIYKPRCRVIEKQGIPKQDKTVLKNQSLAGIMSGHYSKWYSNRMCELDDKEYDIVIHTRPDIYFYEPKIELQTGNFLYYGSVHHNDAASDAFMYGKPEVMTKTAEYVNHCKDTMAKYKLTNNEQYFNKWVEDQNIARKRIDYYMPIHWKIARSWLNPIHDEYESDPLTWSHYYNRRK